ncbi:MAG: hypothetical protein DBP02_07625 [gamma proteobacterium symbiont of Ctena orbiculata]|nr:MAG: hypothetical protein DBP02_07625 [gamma proteobacterium symbiont of Ctena orbiculata]
MEGLEFTEIVSLLNHSRTTKLDPEPTKRSKGNWELYQGEYKVHLSTLTFNVLYLHSHATAESIKQARAQAFQPGVTQVVYAPSLDQRRQTHHEILKPEADTRFWTTKEYLASILREELDAYRERISQLEPKFYTEPPVRVPAGVNRKIPNPLYSLLTDPDFGSLRDSGRLGIMLAEPGQGKTYMSQYLVAKLTGLKKDIIPIYIDSNQWRSMSVDDLTSIWKTIAHSFRYFDTPIGWIEGCEDLFIKTTLKAGLFRIVFDGFDEYVLRNHGRVQAGDAIQALLELVNATGARIVVTSRTTFWESEIRTTEVDDELSSDKSASIFVIEPFERNHAENYFKNRLKGNDQKIKTALEIFTGLRVHGESFVGRGFVLNLIADLVSRNPTIRPDVGKQSPIQWLMTAICEREQLRQELPINSEQQLKVLRIFISDVVQGNPNNTETLDYAISEVASNLDTDTRELCIAKLSPHPLINKTSDQDEWVIPQEQIKVALLSEHLVSLVGEGEINPLLSAFCKNADIGSSLTNDLAAMILEITSIDSPMDEKIQKFRIIIESFLSCDEKARHISERVNAIKILAVLVALKVVDKFVKKGSSREERSEFLIDMFPHNRFMHLPFSGTIASMDLCGIEFESCRFDHVRWASCKFDQDSKFTNCHFIGGSESNCEGFGDAQWINPTSDEEGRSLIGSAQIKAGKKQYTENDLKSDIQSVISRFIGKGGMGFKSMTNRNIKTGTIKFSKHADLIIEELKKRVLEEHHISGSSEQGYGVSEEARDCVRFFADNNVFTGNLQEVYERLQTKLNL